MKNFIKQNWFKLGVLFVLLFTALTFVFYRQPAKTADVASSTTVASGGEYAPEIKQFISDLPNGDVDPQKCKELVTEFQPEMLSGSQYFLSDSKYIYSKKLCLAETLLIRYQGAQSVDQILDLGSNEIFSERDMGRDSPERIFLFGKEQKSFQDYYSLWLAVKDQL